MSAPITAPRHPWELLLAQLSGRTGRLHLFGVESDAKGPPFDRVIWIPTTPTFEACPFNLPGCNVVELIAVAFEVAIYGGSFLEVVQLAKDLDGWMDVIAGRPQGTAGDLSATPPVPPAAGYVFRAKGPPVTGGDLGASTWRLELVVTLKDFVLSEIRPLLVVGSVDITATAQADANTSAGIMETP